MSKQVTSSISESRISDCLKSAGFWCTRLGLYSNQMSRMADRYAIAAALLSTLTGLGVWSTLAASTKWPAVLAVSITALVAAVIAIIPKVKGYGECAKIAADLAPRYAHVLGVLKDVQVMLTNGDPKVEDYAQKAIEEFEQIKSTKDGLKPFPAKLQQEINEIRSKG